MAAANDSLSSGFDSPKVKPPLEAEFSALEDVAPNATPLPAPNLKPEVAAGSSDFLSSLAAVPNLKPSDEPPNLNPAEGAESFEVVSDGGSSPDWTADKVAFTLVVPPDVPNLNPADVELEELFGKPNLNPPDSEAGVVSEVPNLKPTDPEPESVVVSDAPNLNPLDTDSEPVLVSDVPNLNPPDPEPKAVVVPDEPNLNPTEVELPEPNAEDVPPAAQREHRNKDKE